MKELLQNVDTFCINYQPVKCLYTILKYRFSDKIAMKSGPVFVNVQTTAIFRQGNREVDKNPSIAKKRHLGEN